MIEVAKKFLDYFSRKWHFNFVHVNLYTGRVYGINPRVSRWLRARMLCVTSYFPSDGTRFLDRIVPYTGGSVQYHIKMPA